MPTIKDSTDKKYLCGAQSEVDVSQAIRTEKTIEYNGMLKTKCLENDYAYIDITDSIMHSGIVKEDFSNENVYDHHLNSEKTYTLWISQLDKLFEDVK